MLIQSTRPQGFITAQKPSLVSAKNEKTVLQLQDAVEIREDSREKFNARPLFMAGGAALGTAAAVSLFGFSQGVGGFPGIVTGALTGAIGGALGTFQFVEKSSNFGSADEALVSAFLGVAGGAAGFIGGATLGGFGYGTSATVAALSAAAGATGGFYLGSALGFPKTGWEF